MKRNKLFGAAALLMAGAAIGAGASITQSVMADDSGNGGADSVTMVNIGEDGSAVSCTFTGAAAEGLVPELPVAVAPTGAVGDSGVLTVSGPTQVVGQGTDRPIEVKAGDVPAGAIPVGEGVITATAEAGGGVVLGSTVDGKVLFSDVREGTAEECAAMRADGLQAVANAVPTDNAAKQAAIDASNGTKP